MTKRIPCLQLIIFMLLSGCLSTKNAAAPQGMPLPERFSLPMVAEKMPEPSEGAIFNPRSKNIYADSRAREIGDIIMVNIVETSSGKKKAETKTSRDSTFTGGISSLFGFEKILTGPEGRHTPSLTSIDADLAKEFQGKGETTRDSTVTATLSARIIDKTIDGNFLIRGYREVRVNNETQHIILSGLIRPTDISKDNSILSSHIADARIEYTGSGSLSAKQQPGWLANTLDVIWPF